MAQYHGGTRRFDAGHSCESFKISPSLRGTHRVMQWQKPLHGTSRRWILSCCATAAVSACSIPVQANASEIGSQLQALYEREWQRWLAEDPINATSVGDPRYNDRWPELTPAALQKSYDADLSAERELEGTNTASLSAQEKLDYDIVLLEFKRRTDAYRFKPYLYAINQQGGVQTANEVAELAPFATVEDYEHWISRLRNFGRYMDQNIELLRIAMRERRTQPRVIMERIVPQIAAQRVRDASTSPFFTPLKSFPAAIGAADRERLRREALDAIRASVLPAFARFDDFFRHRYLPACRTSVGIDDTPDGAEFYRERIAYHTTTHLSPHEIHALGLAEVKRIRAEMDRVIAELKFQGGFQAFAQMLRTDPRFFYQDANELFRGYVVIAKTIDPQLVKLFGKLPRTPYGVRPVPATSAPDNTTAYYQPLAQDGSRPGYFYVNLYKPESRPKWEMEVLSAHEAVPGHHLQIALQYENAADTPNIRRQAGFTAFVEGWGLYSEGLGDQIGLYADPYSKFGQLTYDMWRAVRLVVDTGMHAQHWTRQQAIDYFKANAPKAELDITNEIDRYISWPGQALAYKIGQLKMLSLREEAQRTLGAKFDIRAFHDALLSTGAVPLDVMERNMREWMQAQAQAQARTR